MTEQAGAFTCKRCGEERPADQEVVTRYHTRTCKRCWGAMLSKARREQIANTNSERD